MPVVAGSGLGNIPTKLRVNSEWTNQAAGKDMALRGSKKFDSALESYQGVY